ncbi:unnamed protein product [Closterium sp. NIES-65]|nr:unnamed protein product [Closterium sp. NIES-65]CAI6011718.1 unnamed protein product [Closterium sp. NIES-65]
MDINVTSSSNDIQNDVSGDAGDDDRIPLDPLLPHLRLPASLVTPSRFPARATISPCALPYSLSSDQCGIPTCPRPDPPCLDCRGSGRVECTRCYGRDEVAGDDVMWDGWMEWWAQLGSGRRGGEGAPHPMVEGPVCCGGEGKWGRDGGVVDRGGGGRGEEEGRGEVSMDKRGRRLMGSTSMIVVWGRSGWIEETLIRAEGRKGMGWRGSAATHGAHEVRRGGGQTRWAVDLGAFGKSGRDGGREGRGGGGAGV